jgi:hypothetical protein
MPIFDTVFDTKKWFFEPYREAGIDRIVHFIYSGTVTNSQTYFVMIQSVNRGAKRLR